MTKFAEKLLKLGNRAIKKAQDNNRKNGIPNVYCINGKIVFEGTPQEMLAQNTPYTKQFVTASLEGPMQMITE